MVNNLLIDFGMEPTPQPETSTPVLKETTPPSQEEPVSDPPQDPFDPVFAVETPPPEPTPELPVSLMPETFVEQTLLVVEQEKRISEEKVSDWLVV